MVLGVKLWFVFWLFAFELWWVCCDWCFVCCYLFVVFVDCCCVCLSFVDLDLFAWVFWLLF